MNAILFKRENIWLGKTEEDFFFFFFFLSGKKKIVAIMIQYKQKLLKIIRQKRQYHNIAGQVSEGSYQDISML